MLRIFFFLLRRRKALELAVIRDIKPVALLHAVQLKRNLEYVYV